MEILKALLETWARQNHVSLDVLEIEEVKTNLMEE